MLKVYFSGLVKFFLKFLFRSNSNHWDKLYLLFFLLWFSTSSWKWRKNLNIFWRLMHLLNCKTFYLKLNRVLSKSQLVHWDYTYNWNLFLKTCLFYVCIFLYFDNEAQLLHHSSWKYEKLPYQGVLWKNHVTLPPNLKI